MYSSGKELISPFARSELEERGIQHVAVLGDTIEQIAWYKSGIFKVNCPAFTVKQVPAAA